MVPAPPFPSPGLVTPPGDCGVFSAAAASFSAAPFFEEELLATPLFLSPLKNLNLSNIEFLLLAPAPKLDCLDAVELLLVEELAPDAEDAHELVLVALIRRPAGTPLSEPGARIPERPPGVGMLDTELLGEVDREVLTESRLVALLCALLPPLVSRRVVFS